MPDGGRVAVGRRVALGLGSVELHVGRLRPPVWAVAALLLAWVVHGVHRLPRGGVVRLCSARAPVVGGVGELGRVLATGRRHQQLRYTDYTLPRTRAHTQSYTSTHGRPHIGANGVS